MANPSGPVHACAYDELTACILAAAPGCDAVLLDLHGAMVAENTPDGEGDLLLAVVERKTGELTKAALHIDPVAIDEWRASRACFEFVGVLLGEGL